MNKLRIPSNLTALAYKSIKGYILDGRLDETSRLTEEFLSAQLGISKSPVREALNRLESEGLIRIEPRRGAYLRTFSLKDIGDAYEVREALETHVVRTAVLSPGLLAELNKSLQKMREHLRDNDRASYIEEDTRFHAVLAESTGNTLLCQHLENIQNQIWLFRRKTYDLSSSTAAEHHQSIIQDLEANDKRAAEQHMREHIAKVRTKLLDFLASEESEPKSTISEEHNSSKRLPALVPR